MHQGHWICAAQLTGSDSESFDEFRVNVFDSENLGGNTVNVAGVSGMAVASIFVIAAIIFISYRRYRKTHRSRPTTRQTVVSYVTGADAISISSHNTNDDPILVTT